MEASALSHTASSPQVPLGRSPLLRLQSDEKLVALTRRGHLGAFDALVHRYQARLQSFCRHMLGSTEDAEDVLQEVFASAYNAILADDRPINARPWLYRIARNRSLNHLRRPQHAGQDSMDVYERAGGETTADAVHRREDLRLLIADVQQLPETQRTALLMREIDALSYEQIAEAMDTTVAGIKSLLVRARVGLAEAAEARLLSCDEVRLSLAEAAEGLTKVSAPARRHVKSCKRCRLFRGELRRTSRALAAVYPVGPLVVFQKLVWGKVGLGGGSSAGGSGAMGGSTVAGGSAWSGAASGSAVGSGLLGGGAGAGGLLSTGVGAIATKAAAGLVAAAVVTAGAVEIQRRVDGPPAAPPAAAEAPAPPADAPPEDAQAPAAAVGDETGAEPAAEVAATGEAEPAPAASGTETPAEATALTTTSAEGSDGSGQPVSPDTSVSDGSSGPGEPVLVDGGGSDGSTAPVDGAGSSPGNDGGGSSPPPGGGGDPSSPPPTAPPGDPIGSSSPVRPQMRFGAGEPAGSG